MKKLLIVLAAIILAVIIILAYDLVAISAPPSTKLVSVIETTIPPQLEPATTTPTSATLMFGGDVMLSRVVNQKSTKSGDWAWPFIKIASTTADADLFVVNLESPFTIGGSHLVKTGSFSFNADPLSIAGLKLAGVDAVSLANNHTINQGKRGIADTQKLLTENKISFAGAGLNEAEARTPIIKEVNGTKFGLLAYAYPDDYSVAGTATAGLANMNILKMQQDVQKLKSQVDVVIIMNILISQIPSKLTLPTLRLMLVLI
jgi:poly-gamma-glutamate synthesis protein (capsule biosynthesis protein)